MTARLFAVAALLTVLVGCETITQAPTTYTGDSEALVRFMDPQRVDQVCAFLTRQPAEHDTILACAVTAPDETGLIISPHPCPSDNEPFAWKLCHEVQHINGMEHSP